MILVTGGTGLVGGHLLWHLLNENERVSAICRKTSDPKPLHSIFSYYTSNPDDFLKRIDWRIADVLDETSIQEALVGVDVLFHCAAVVSLGNNSGSLMDTNVRGTRNVVQAALKNRVAKFCFVSSIAACGRASTGGKVDENCKWNDSPHQSQYVKSKYYSEQEVWKGIAKGLPAFIVNPGVILGVSGTVTGSSQLFNQVQKGLIFYTNGGSGYVAVQDVVKAMILLSNSPVIGERFVLVGDNCSNKDILYWMADGFGKRRPFIRIGKRMLWTVGILSEFIGKVFHFSPLIDRSTARSATRREYYSAQKIENTFGFQFTSIEKCIKEVCEFRNRTRY
jgi:nucleoside-diphosphate-sugar epimerase